jgi:hypothetical protein
VVPATIVEIDPSAFSRTVWGSYVTFEGAPLFLIDDDFILSLDSRVVLRHLSDGPELLIGSNIEAIGAKAFWGTGISSVQFESGTRLREIGPGAFAFCDRLEVFTVPESVEILADRRFKGCSEMETIRFEGSSRLKRIGEKAFMGCKLHSITIPAMVEEIDGSAFLKCPVLTGQVAPGNRNFKVEGNVLLTSDGTGLVRYFGLNREIAVGRKVKVLRKSCFERCKQLTKSILRLDPNFSESAELHSVTVNH